jgi:carboxypeptidase Taq
MGIHESQSRLYENVIGRSKEFWKSLLPKIKREAAPVFRNLNLKQFVGAINEVKASKIRIEADEITYNLHIIVRFQIEQALFADRITVAELPTLWNEKYKETLGVIIENDSEGIMQDTHWASGLYGYFPTYTLGNIYTGHIVKAIKRENRDWLEEIEQGSLENVKNWLTKNIYRYGNLLDPAELIEKATGEELDVSPYLDYLEDKYSTLYGF